MHKNLEFIKDSIVLDNNSLENLNDNQKKIIESLLSDRDLLKFLENKMNQVSTGNNLNFIESKNISNNFTNSNYNFLKLDPNITRDKIDLFKENISHLFYSYNNELEVPKLEEDKLSESNKSNKEKLNENSDCEPYELCNSNSSKEDFGVSKLSADNIKKNNNIEKNLNPNSFNNNLNINNNDDTIYCLRESLEEKSNKKFIRNHKNKTIQNEANNSSSNDKLTKTFFKENKTEYFKNLSKSQKNEKSILGKNSPNMTTMIHNLKTISSNSNQKDKKLPYFLKINKVDSENEGEGKYTFRKYGKDSISKNKTYCNIKMSPILKQIDNDEEFFNICTNVNNNTFTIDMKNTNQKFNDNSNFLEINRNIDKKRTSQIKPNSKSYSERFHILRIKNNSNPNDKLNNNKEIKSIKITKNKNKSNVFKNQSHKKQIFSSSKNEKPLLQSKNNNFKENVNNLVNILEQDKSLLIQKEKINSNKDFDNNINDINKNNNNFNSNKNQLNAIDFINEEFRKIVSVQDKNKSNSAFKFLNLDNLDIKSNNNSNFNNNFLNSFSPRDFLPNEISIKDEYKSSFKSESLMNPWSFNSTQKNDVNKFLNLNKPYNNNEDLEMDIESPEFINNFSNNNGLENTHKTAINEMSNINCENFNSLNMENEKDFILVDNIDNLCNAGKQKKSNINIQQCEEDNVNYNYEKNQKLEIPLNKNKTNNYEQGLNTHINKKSDVCNKIPNYNNEVLNNNKKSSSIIDVLTQEARDRAIIKVESEKIVSGIHNNINPMCLGKGNKKTQNNNQNGIINNYNNIYITEVHTYTGRKKNVKNFK